MLRKPVTLAASAMLLAALALVAAAQSTGGAVTGTVVDQNGAAVPNATVTLRNKATGQAPIVQTTDAGAYSFPIVPVGEYTLTAEAAGFAQVNTEIKVSLNQTTGVDVTLSAAGVTENVEVTPAGEALVQSDTSQLGRSYETSPTRTSSRTSSRSNCRRRSSTS